jgi:arylsulfatase A-like enzyme
MAKLDKNMDRRDFLKALSLLSMLSAGVQFLGNDGQGDSADGSAPNFLILVFDTFSAEHVSLYGYPRQTTPNLERIAEKATVFHSHYSAGNFTTPSTASLLTGTYTWTNRAFSHQATIIESLVNKNLFSQFGRRGYENIGFSQNFLVDIILHNLRQLLDEFTLPNDVSLVDYNLLEDIFFKDYVVAQRAERVYLKKPGKLSNSLYLAPIYKALTGFHRAQLEDEYRRKYPWGIPGYHDMLYPLEDTLEWALERIRSWSNPYLAYLHFMPPHDPYLPSSEFAGLFFDDWKPVPKPPHFYSEGETEENLWIQRQHYDQYIAYVDARLGYLYDALQSQGLLENTWLIITSDHGELFERGIWKHTTRTLFESVIHVPLVISAPGQEERRDVFEYTSCVDLLPTLLHLSDQSLPSWLEGRVLPPYSDEVIENDRPIYVIEAKSNPKFRPISKATLSVRRGQYKLVYYNYEDFEGVTELYDLENDPEEMNNLSTSRQSIAAELKGELLKKLAEVNQPYAG